MAFVMNPELVPSVMDLYAGPRFDPPPNSYPPSLRPQPSPDEPLSFPVGVDLARLWAVHTFNYFQFNIIEPGASQPSAGSDTSAIYLLPSLINHRCIPNAVALREQSVMVIRALTAISQNDEVMISYTSSMDFGKRREALQRYGISCKCQLCVLDRRDGKNHCRQRYQILKSARERDMGDLSTVTKVLLLVKETYLSEQTRRPELFSLYMYRAWNAYSNTSPLPKDTGTRLFLK